jgi:GntR family transcriptional repressor for pyruvate dehydrogenase complex
LSELALHEIERMIDEEFAVPGSRLPKEADLAERFQVSRIVIREAMKILEDRGLVEVSAGRGTFTVSPKPDRVKESLMRLFRDQPVPTMDDMELLLELRQALEETTASLAAVRATEEDLKDIEDALLQMKNDSFDLDENISADLRFHRAVMRAAHNQYFEIVLDPLTEVFQRQIKLTNSYALGWELHRSILVEIRARNPIGARQAVRRLMKRTLSDSRHALDKLSTGSEEANRAKQQSAGLGDTKMAESPNGTEAEDR